MNVVYFKVDHPPHDKINPVHFYLKAVQLLRDDIVIAELDDLKITTLPFYIFRTVPTGFGKIDYRLRNKSQLRVNFSSGYLRSGEYIVATPEGEITLPFNALTGLWTLDKREKSYLDHQGFFDRNYRIIRPVKSLFRGAFTL